jgi:DNA-binding protein HU-beta
MADKAKASSKAKAPAKAAAKAKTSAKAPSKAKVVKAMTKTEIIAHLAGKFELSKKVAGEILLAISDLAVSETKKTGQFVLPGIGKLVKAQRKARVGINPKTKEKIKIAAKTVVKFRVAKAAKESIGPGK